MTQGKLQEQLEFAKTISDNSLQEVIDNFKRREQDYDRGKMEYSIYTDFAPRSFEFAATIDGQFWMNGGIIYHGQHGEFTSGAPTFSTVIGKAKGWEVHT